MLLGGGSNTTDSADQDISFLNFNGGFFGTTVFLLDGSWNTDPEWGAVIFVPSVVGDQEFKIQNNSFTAKYGWSTGNVFNVVTKAATNAFHGSAYEFYADNTLNNEGSIFNPNALNPISFAAGIPVVGALQFLGPGQRNVYNPNYENIAPRVGFSYQPIPKAVVHGGYGIFYPQSVTCCFPTDPDGFSATTYINPSLNGGITPNPNISTGNPWGGAYAQLTGNKNGGYQQDGNGLTSTFTSRPAPYVQQWMLGVQYAIAPSDELEVDYIGNRGVRMIGGRNDNQLNPSYLSMGANFLGAAAASNPFAAPLQTLEAGGTVAPSGCNLDNAGATNAQLLSPYPQYCNGGVSQTDAPFGQSLYNALQVMFNHRVSKGLTALVSYTYSKFLDNVAGNNGWSYNGPTNWGVTPANNYNLAADKSVDGDDIPQALVASYIYQLPIGCGRAFGSEMGRTANAVVGGWELSGIATFKDGIPLGIFGSDQPSYGGNPRPDVIGNPKMSKPTLHEWFNTGAFAFAPYGSFGTAPRYFSDVRGPRFQDWDTAIEKNWLFGETMRAQFRFETFNSFNHPNFYAPGAGSTSYSGCDPNASSCASSFAQITNAFLGRIIQWAGKFYW